MSFAGWLREIKCAQKCLEVEIYSRAIATYLISSAARVAALVEGIFPVIGNFWLQLAIALGASNIAVTRGIVYRLFHSSATLTSSVRDSHKYVSLHARFVRGQIFIV